jgi:hypothetical protein
MITEIVAGVLAGYVAHQAEPWVCKSFGNGWRQMVSYTIGVLVTFPIALVTHRKLSEITNQDKRLTLTWFLSFFSVGSGCLLGWILYKPDEATK